MHNPAGHALGFPRSRAFCSKWSVLMATLRGTPCTPAFGEAIANLALPALELEPADWNLYKACAKAMLSCCWCSPSSNHVIAIGRG